MNIYDLTQPDLRDFLQDEPAFRAKQIYRQVYAGKAFADMTDIPADLRTKLNEAFTCTLPQIIKKLTSALDGTVKYLFAMADGAAIESVVMRYEHGYSICVSSQAGCRMGCAFCASTVGGLERNLTAGEIMGQVLAAQRDLHVRISNVVMMGSGEPLDNYDNALAFIRNAIHPDGLGIGARHITLSTCGLADGLRRLMTENLQINLAISLHAPNDEIRRSLLPVARTVDIQTLVGLARTYFETTHRRVTFEYALVRDVNDQPVHAAELAALLGRYEGFHVNLIPVNEIKERTYRKSTTRTATAFSDILKQNGVNATVRRRMGADIDAACGQLRNSVKNRPAVPENER